MTRARWFVVAFAAIALAASFYLLPKPAIAADNPGFDPNATVRVYFRGDAAGQAVGSYIGSVTNNASISGSVKSIDDQWLVLTASERTCYLPRSVILMIEKTK